MGSGRIVGSQAHLSSSSNDHEVFHLVPSNRIHASLSSYTWPSVTHVPPSEPDLTPPPNFASTQPSSSPSLSRRTITIIIAVDVALAVFVSLVLLILYLRRRRLTRLTHSLPPPVTSKTPRRPRPDSPRVTMEIRRSTSSTANTTSSQIAGTLEPFQLYVTVPAPTATTPSKKRGSASSRTPINSLPPIIEEHPPSTSTSTMKATDQSQALTARACASASASSHQDTPTSTANTPPQQPELDTLAIEGIVKGVLRRYGVVGHGVGNSDSTSIISGLSPSSDVPPPKYAA